MGGGSEMRIRIIGGKKMEALKRIGNDDGWDRGELGGVGGDKREYVDGEDIGWANARVREGSRYRRSWGSGKLL